MWKFENEDGKIIFSEKELQNIFPLTREYSTELWKIWISEVDGQTEFRMIDQANVNMKEEVFCPPRCGWGNEEQQNKIIKRLKDTLNLNEDEPITYFWQSFEAIETIWGIYTKYWTDFWYPGYEGIVIPHNSDKAIIFTENSYMLLVDRKKCFGLH